MTLPKISKIITLSAVSILFAAGIANAGLLQTATAKLEAPLTAPQYNLVAAEVAWNCEGDVCQTNIDRRTPMARDCRQLARKVGKIASFKVGNLELPEAELARCNANL